MSVCTSGAPERSADSMPKLRSIEMGRTPPAARSMQRVARAAREVEDHAARRECEVTDRPLAPAHIETERDDPVQSVVLRRDRVEHALDGGDLLLSLGEIVGVP
jgi:hypothetical protein